MILGVDHIALSCGDLETAVRAWSGHGYSAAFCQRGLINHAGKKALLTEFAPTHDVAYLQGRGGIAIELTRHSLPNGFEASPYDVMFLGPVPPDAQALSQEHEQVGLATGDHSWRGYAWPMIGSTAWFGSSADSQTWIRAVMLRVPDVQAARRLWTDALGASCRASSASWAWVQWARPVAAWSLDLFLVQSQDPVGTPVLDQPGFTCLALLTNRLEPDLARATAAGGTVACEPFRLTVNGRQLGVAIIRGLADELIELIQVR